MSASDGEPGVPDSAVLPVFVGVLWRHKIAVLVGLLVGALLGVGVSFLQPTSYTASSRIFFSSQDGFNPLAGQSYNSDPSRHLELQAALLTSEPVLMNAVGSEPAIGSTQQVRKSLTVTPSSEADIVTVKATGANPRQAADRIATVVQAFRSYQKDAVDQQTSDLLKLTDAGGRRTIQQRAALYGDGVQLVEPPTTQQTSTTVFDGVVGAVVGLLLGLAWAVARATRAHSPRRGSVGSRVPDWGIDHPESGAPATPHAGDRTEHTADHRQPSLARRN